MKDDKTGTDFESVPVLSLLSIVIPTLNETATLPLLLADLAGQLDVELEVLVSDGDSRDGTAQLATTELARHGLRGKVLTGAPGRGRQMNRAATQARGAWLLFLHADSRLADSSALCNALNLLSAAGHPRVAGHFALRFMLDDGEAELPYRYCEIKARLGLLGTIHGDQGFLLTTAFFRELGGFREDLPILEDTLLAERVRRLGEWWLLPAEIGTSPRRFQVEGFRSRQTLNALLVNFAMIGWDEPLRRTPDLYSSQDRARPLQLAPFFRLIDVCLRDLPWCLRLRLWYRTGSFVRGNAWQVVLWRAVRRSWWRQMPAEQSLSRLIDNFQRWFEPLTDHPPGRLLTALLTWMWFRTRSRCDDMV